MICKWNAHIRSFTGCILLFGCLFLVQVKAQEILELQGFDQSPFFDEQVITFRLNDDMTIHIDAASIDSFRADLPIGLVLYALPNGNTIEHTVGKVLQTGDDWHYNIQHIGAQTRFLRDQIQDYNLVTVYLESTQLSWPSWKTHFPNYDDITRETIEYLLSCFEAYDPFIVLSSHSGGGRFIFSYLDGVNEIPDYIKRICFLDSNYGYEHSYGDQLINWLDGSPDRFLSVLAYNDSVALYNGEPIVSPTGGTWYRTRIMQTYLANHYEFATEEDDVFIHHEALGGRIEIILKKNPTQAILHTVQVERNGFIHTLLSGTDQANLGYTYYGERAYDNLIQTGILVRSPYQIPLRSMNAPNGSQFMTSLLDMSFNDRENAILNQLRSGNVPYFLRDLKNISAAFEDAAGSSHIVGYEVMPDYLSIGTDTNYCRVPMGPITAQRAADFFGLIMPTRKLVDHIYTNTDIQLAPVTYAPVGNQNEGVPKFIEHNTAIEAQLNTAGASLGQLIGGTKKDVVLSNLIIDPSRPGHVTIYGWHQLNGSPIQPLTNIHTNTYVDYSHGIRYMDGRVTIDGVINDAVSVLRNSIQYRLLSDESGPMNQPTYIPDGSLPSRPTSFGAASQNSGEVEIFIEPDPNILDYQLFVSSDGLTFDQPFMTIGNTHTLGGLDPDTILYFKLIAENLSGSSSESEVLSVLPNGASDTKVLVVNGFDRSSNGNTYDFIRQHGSALLENGSTFESCTNEAIIDGLVQLSDYLIVDYILGEESTVDETFSNTEQSLITNYLKQGGRLFVSGAEIAWDLDYRGSTSDKAFIHDFLKASYSADAPGGVSGVHYSAEGIQGSILGAITTIAYDNGTHGTFDVKYPDALIPEGGSQSIIRYLNVNTHDIGGVSFEGVFPGGTQPGKLVYIGFPFETIYPVDSRNLVMNEVLDYLLLTPSTTDEFTSVLPEKFELMQNFPNPFNPSTTLRFGIPIDSYVKLTIYNVRGQAIKNLVDDDLSAGRYELVWKGSDDQNRQVATGLYLARLQSGDQVKNVKMLYLK
ncbi:MAG: T9SS type A sorting domain-containing protein [Candidatus Marinimicrobia bacterium]|jgi:hypothetical protein|nr:T9SS type A sorting domain-containing protein [Candidatus Neomarinimicrobiota bacterium]MBT3576977.1 T9SS type A sorting domain-containing protein [Candidatus Neomarinimicrobiota bacterium]MBT3680155.1 T9SS type A sorting domain-containing protein [Candidatus Neomarinimicrobiota bacterium]MBT3951366.1 T9SS type A sorting domain-containing protein [Candidatus Neomarinimicrobiota bacterium]MBT4253941.1 T9SS type A sorting domain-containing protein [Candidatus Neomarinimicrobiota bacterium]